MALLFDMTARNIETDLKIKINNLLGEIDLAELCPAKDDRIGLFDMYSDMLDVVKGHLEDKE